MSIQDFIHVVKEYNDYKEPKKIKIICGISNFYGPIQKFKVINNSSIDIYKHFEYYAFTLDNKCSYLGSDTSIWRILVNNKIDVKQFFSQVKGDSSKNQNEQLSIIKLIYYLYFHEGIVMINRDVDSKTFEIFSKYNVTDVLFVGKSVPYKSLTKYFSGARFGVIYHPSRRVGAKKNWFYDTLDSSAIEEVSYYKKKYEKTSFMNFFISYFI